MGIKCTFAVCKLGMVELTHVDKAYRLCHESIASLVFDNNNCLQLSLNQSAPGKRKQPIKNIPAKYKARVAYGAQGLKPCSLLVQRKILFRLSLPCHWRQQHDTDAACYCCKCTAICAPVKSQLTAPAKERHSKHYHSHACSHTMDTFGCLQALCA